MATHDVSLPREVSDDQARWLADSLDCRFFEVPAGDATLTAQIMQDVAGEVLAGRGQALRDEEQEEKRRETGGTPEEVSGKKSWQKYSSFGLVKKVFGSK